MISKQTRSKLDRLIVLAQTMNEWDEEHVDWDERGALQEELTEEFLPLVQTLIAAKLISISVHMNPATYARKITDFHIIEPVNMTVFNDDERNQIAINGSWVGGGHPTIKAHARMHAESAASQAKYQAEQAARIAAAPPMVMVAGKGEVN